MELYKKSGIFDKKWLYCSLFKIQELTTVWGFLTVGAMELQNDQKLLIGLTSSEAKVFCALSSHGISVTELARITRLPRTTCDHIVKRLLGRGWVESEKYGKRLVWKRVSDKKIKQLLEEVARTEHKTNLSFSQTDIGELVRVAFGQGHEVKVHTGIESLIAIYEELAQVPRGHRVYVVESFATVQAVIERVPTEVITRINKQIRARGIIFEALASDEYFWEASKMAGQEWLESFERKQHILYCLPESEFAKEQMLVFEGKVFFLNWHDGHAVEIANEDIAKLHITMFYTMAEQAKKIALHELIQEVKEKTFGG